MNTDQLTGLTADIFQIIFEKSPGSLLVKSDKPRFTIAAVSDNYLEITSSSREKIVGRGFFEVFPDDKDFNEETSARNVFTRVVDTGQKIEVPTYRYDVFNAQTKKSEIKYWSCCNTPIYDDRSEVAYILNTVVDITGEVKAKEAAIENENRLRIAAEAAAFGTWELKLKDQQLIFSPRIAEIFGHPADAALTIADVRSQVNRDDLQNIAVKAYYESVVSGRFSYEVRIYWPDGTLHWIKTQGILMYDDKKAPASILGTMLDITESKRDEIRKNDFIAMASHELKTPLTSLKAYIQLLSKKLSHSGDTFVENALSKASQQVNRMTDLIHGFLDLSKLEPGKLKLKIQEFEIGKLIEESVAEISATNHQHVISFATDGKYTVVADREKISQVIGNFLSNAIKYSAKGSRIIVSSRKLGNLVEVAVTDEGIGIKASDQKKLFQRFYRVENEKTKNFTGFGIGLYLSSEIIQRHKGTIGVKSKENKGSTFYFSLPLSR
jgi:two-component system CheB/CheR fusion protein